MFVPLEQSGRPGPVVLIVFDEFPVASLFRTNREIDERSFPNFAGLAATSTWFRNTTTVGGFTREALPAVLTGRQSSQRYVPGETYLPRNVFTMLADAYPVRAVEQVPGLCPLTWCDHPRERPTPLGLAAADHGERIIKSASFVELIRTDPGPYFYYLHLVLPHSPWRYLPTGQRYPETQPEPGETDPPGRGNGWGHDRWLATQGWQRHLLQLGLVDRILGKIVAALKTAGLFDDALIVVTADHGVAFEPGLPKRLVRRETVGSIAFVPLFIKRPEQTKGFVTDVPAHVSDVVPTMADVLDLTATWPGLDGISLTSEVPRDRGRSIEGIDISPQGTELDEAIASKVTRLPPLPGGDVFTVAPPGGRSLVPYIGRPVRSVRVRGHGRGRFLLAQGRGYANATPTDSDVPALIEGEIRGLSVTDRRLVAIAIGGKIAAITRTYRTRSAMRFSAMVPPAAFAPGPDVAAFIYKRASGTLIRLHRLRTGA